MKQILLACLIFSCASIAPAAVKHQQSDVMRVHAKKPVPNDFADHDADDAQAVEFGMSVKHDDGTKPIATGSVRALQIFPINSVTGGLTYNFS